MILRGGRHQRRVLPTQTEMLGEPTHKQHEYASPLDEVEVSPAKCPPKCPVATSSETRERDGDRPHAPRGRLDSMFRNQVQHLLIALSLKKASASVFCRTRPLHVDDQPAP